MDFAQSCIDLCRTSDEVHSLLGETNSHHDTKVRRPLQTIKTAIRAKEKKVIIFVNENSRAISFYQKNDCKRCLCVVLLRAGIITYICVCVSFTRLFQTFHFH